MKTLLWLDDLRDPFEGDWVKEYSPIGTDDLLIVWVTDYSNFVVHIETFGLPDAICFDHDLGDEIMGFPEDEKTGYDCAKWLVDLCLDNNIDIPAFNVQSSNPVGKEKIFSLLNNYHKFYLSQNVQN